MMPGNGLFRLVAIARSAVLGIGRGVVSAVVAQWSGHICEGRSRTVGVYAEVSLLLGTRSVRVGDDPFLTDVVHAMHVAGHWGFLVDERWRLVYVTDELRFTFGGHFTWRTS